MPISQVFRHKPADETLLQYLGAATILHWDRIPRQTQQMLLSQANTLGGLDPANEVAGRLLDLIERSRDRAA